MNRSVGIEDSLLNAYIDDELALIEREMVESAMREDTRVAARVEDLRATDSQLRDALRLALEAPAPALVAPSPREEIFEPVPRRWLERVRAIAGLGALKPVAVGFASGVLGALLVTATVMLPGTPEDELAGAGPGTEPPTATGADSEVLRAHSLERALETEMSGNAVSWRNPDRAEFGEVVPVRTYKSTTGKYCRDFAELITRGDKTVKERGVACREDTGTWRVRIRYYP